VIVTVTLNPAVDKALEVPGFEVGAHARARVVSVLPAGKGVNVARGFARLGGRALASGLVGRDEERLYAESLAADEVEARFCTVSGRTRVNTTVLDPQSRTATHLREEGPEVAFRDVERLRALLTDVIAAGGPRAVVFAGSLPPGLGPDGFAGLVAAGAGLGAPAVVDTSGPALRAVVAGRAAEVIKPNLLELGHCLGRSVEQEEALAAAETLLERVGTVLLTLGAEGALLVRPGLTVGRRCPLADGEVRNTVGCGDAFLAGWLRGEEVGEDPAEALCWAVAAGAASAASESTVGYGLEDVERLLPRCEPIP
jgi:1-phosphofructokinase family hexose kinase